MFGLASIILMLIAYTFEHKSNLWILIFSIACLSSSIYAWIIGSIPFTIVEFIWAFIAFKKWFDSRNKSKEKTGNIIK